MTTTTGYYMDLKYTGLYKVYDIDSFRHLFVLLTACHIPPLEKAFFKVEIIPLKPPSEEGGVA